MNTKPVPVIEAEGWVWLRLNGIRCQHYFVVTTERPQVPESLCRKYATHPGIASELKTVPVGFWRDARYDCKACTRRLQKRDAAVLAHSQLGTKTQ